MFSQKPICLAVFLALFSGGFLFSENVSVLVVETGIRDDSPQIQSSVLWETGLMDILFEYGHIVSNAPILRLNADQANPFPAEQLLDIEEARTGGARYYILAVLSYSGTDEKKSGPLTPRLVSLKLVRLYPYKVMYEKQIPGVQGKVQDELENAKKAAQAMIPYFKEK